MYHILAQRWTPDRIDGSVSWFERAWARLRKTVPAGAHEKLLEELSRVQDERTTLLTKCTAYDAECIRLRAKTIGLETRLIHVDEECSRQRAFADELRTSLKVSRNVVRAKDEMIASLERKIGPKDREIERTRDQHAKAIGAKNSEIYNCGSTRRLQGILKAVAPLERRP
jgi:chromosome segregation ATPase